MPTRIVWMTATIAATALGCSETGSLDDTAALVYGWDEACHVGSTTPLSDTPEADWPEGLSAAYSAYEASAGTWRVEIECEDAPELNGEATVELGACTVHQFELSTAEGWCEGVTHVAQCNDAPFSFSGWPEVADFSGMSTSYVIAEPGEPRSSLWRRFTDGYSFAVVGDSAERTWGAVDAPTPGPQCLMVDFERL